MSQKTFFSVAAIIILAIAAFFSIKLAAMGELQCIPQWTFYCDVQAQVFCGGGDYSASMSSSECQDGDCVGHFKLLCIDDGRKDNLNCVDEENPGCVGDW